MTKELGTVFTKYKGLRLSVKHRMRFSRKEMDCLEAKVIKVTQQRDASGANTEQLFVDVQCVSKLPNKFKTLCERV